MRTLGWARDGGPRRHFDATTRDVDGVLADCDVLVSALPSTAATRGLLGGGRLAACGRSPLFLNVGRGDLLGEDDVLAALAAGHVREAVLDVFAEEPLSADSPLWASPGVRVTPHVAALSLPADVAAVFCDNLDRWTRGEELRYAVDWEKGY